MIELTNSKGIKPFNFFLSSNLLGLKRKIAV